MQGISISTVIIREKDNEDDRTVFSSWWDADEFFVKMKEQFKAEEQPIIETDSRFENSRFIMWKENINIPFSTIMYIKNFKPDDNEDGKIDINSIELDIDDD